MNPQIDEFLSTLTQWKEELGILRRIILECGLVEEYKWRQPCYTYNGGNILILGYFKEFCTIGFFKGVFLKDSEGLLVQQGKNTRSARIIPFKSAEEILKIEEVVKAYIFEAIEVEKVGLKVEQANPEDQGQVEELEIQFQENPTFKIAFEALTPGRQRAYLMFFSAGKQSKTRAARIEKYKTRILNGKGMNDCVCGFSKRMPNCDGSHKHIKEQAG